MEEIKVGDIFYKVKLIPEKCRVVEVNGSYAYLINTIYPKLERYILGQHKGFYKTPLEAMKEKKKQLMDEYALIRKFIKETEEQ